VFELVDERTVAPILVNICHRIRPAFEKSHDEIRKASFQLFGTLNRFGNNQGAAVFYEQLHNNLPCLYLHVNDPSEQVQRACKVALKRLAPLMRCKDIVAFFEETLDEDRSINYTDFLNQLSIILVCGGCRVGLVVLVLSCWSCWLLT
jgi:maestro heat-like repeat-containing protein family member 1